MTESLQRLGEWKALPEKSLLHASSVETAAGYPIRDKTDWSDIKASADQTADWALSELRLTFRKAIRPAPRTPAVAAAPVREYVSC